MRETRSVLADSSDALHTPSRNEVVDRRKAVERSSDTHTRVVDRSNKTNRPSRRSKQIQTLAR